MAALILFFFCHEYLCRFSTHACMVTCVFYQKIINAKRKIQEPVTKYESLCTSESFPLNSDVASIGSGGEASYYTSSIAVPPRADKIFTAVPRSPVPKISYLFVPACVIHALCRTTARYRFPLSQRALALLPPRPPPIDDAKV